jgi:rubrerythrin
MPKQQEVRGGYCPVADAERPLAFRGTTEALSGYTVRAWTCRVCGATIHEPVGDAPFGRHRRVDCPIECLGKGT